jgi:2-oxoisovalerate dehydrogenase E1 component beta subunit
VRIRSDYEFRCKMPLSLGRWNSIVVRAPSGGGIHGGPFHSQNPEMHFVHTPELKVVCPSTAYDAKGLAQGGNPRS